MFPTLYGIYNVIFIFQFLKIEDRCNISNYNLSPEVDPIDWYDAMRRQNCAIISHSIASSV